MNYVLKIKNTIFSQLMSRVYANLICVLIIALVVYGSIWQGYYNIDGHHWGLMLSNAKDLYDGKLPYQYIFIQYGILTTAIHALAYGWAGGNLISIITITAIAYAIGLLLIYRITISLTGNIKIALYAIITCYLIHPIAIYPWSNYIAFPFLVYGILMLIKKPRSKNAFFLSGLSFGLAILSREGLAPAIILILVISTLLDIFQPDRNNKKYITSILSFLTGLLLPIITFCLYLSYYGLWAYWYKLSWLLPKIYIAEHFPHVAGFSGLIGLLTQIIKRAANLDFRWLLLGVVISVNLYIAALMIARRKRTYLTSEVAIIAFATLLLLSSSLHIVEVFRLATGSMIGVVTLYVLLTHFKQANYSFIFILYTLGLTLTALNSGIYSWPGKDMVRSAQYVKSPSFFYGQRWQSDVIQYYQQIDLDLKHLKNSSCVITFHYNYTMDAFLQVLSPYLQYQVAPFGLGATMSALRPDLNYKKKISDSNNIIIFQMVSEKDITFYKPPENFYIYRYYLTTHENRLLILIPSICEQSMSRLNATFTGNL